MNVFGMGPLEVLIVLLIAFVFLGPERMVTAGRWLGRAVAEIRRMSAELPELVIDEEASESPDKSLVRRATTARAEPERPSETTDSAAPAAGEDGPVPFQRPSPEPDSNGAGQPPGGHA